MGCEQRGRKGRKAQLSVCIDSTGGGRAGRRRSKMEGIYVYTAGSLRHRAETNITF